MLPKSKRHFSTRLKDEDGNTYYENRHDPGLWTTSWDDPEPGVSSGSSDTSDSMSASGNDNEEQQHPSVEWNRNSIRQAQELIDQIDMMAAGEH